MTSTSRTVQNSNESRIAGGPTSHGSARTLRRVQRSGKDHVRIDDGNPDTSPQQSVHELDEMGLDPSAFETLRYALEKHSKEHLRTEAGLQEGDPNVFPLIPPRAVVPLRDTASILASRQNPSAGPFSGESVPIISDNPYPITDTPQVQVSQSRGRGSSPTKSSPTAADISTHLSSSTLVAERTRDIPGEVWIDPLEREGLPVQAPISIREAGNPVRRRSTWLRGSRDEPHLGERHVERLAEHQAAGVVRTHTRRGWGRLHRSPHGRNGRNTKGLNEEKEPSDHSHRRTEERGKASEDGRHHIHPDTGHDTKFADGGFPRPGRMRKAVPGSWLGPAMHLPHMHIHHNRHQPEDHHRGYPHGPNLGNGVLSALLALYGHDHDHDDEGSASGTSSPDRRSRTSSDARSEEYNLPKPSRPWLPDEDSHDHSSSMGQKDRHREKFSFGRSSKGGPASSIFAHIRSPSLPTASTTAALIAGAGSLSGAAAPQQATLAPNLKKAGYNLVRYSVEEVPRATQRIPAIFPKHRRTRSTDSGTAVTDHPTREIRDSEEESSATPPATIIGSPTFGSEGVENGGKELITPGGRRGWTGRLNLPLSMHLTPGHHKAPSSLSGSPKENNFRTSDGSGSVTPGSTGGTPVNGFEEKKDYFDPKAVERETRRIRERKKERKERERQRDKEKRRKRKKAEVYITRHVAEILQRQEFIMKLSRAMMMFGGPSHRLAAQIQSTGRVLDLELSCMYLPDVMLISFEDSTTGTSNVKFIRQSSALDLEKLGDAHALYWNVIHDEISVSAASASLDVLMRKQPLYNFVQLTIIGGMCSASICSVSFSGSFIDSLASAPLGALLVAIQLIGVRNELYVNVFEITIATLLSFLSAALASTKHFCYSAVASSSVVLILPGFIVLSGSLELSSRSLVAGAVRLCFALMYSLFLGFGLAIGAELYEKIIEQPVVGPTDYICMKSHDPTGPWWQQTPSLWWAFLTVPMYSLFLSMRLMAPWWKKEMVLLIAIASIGWVTNHFTGTKFPNQSDISAAVGAFAVGFVSNMYGRFFHGNAFVVMITGILFQVPSGLGNGGLLNFVSDQTSGSSLSYLSGFQTALQLISVAIGLTVGLGISLVLVHPIQSRRRAGGLFSL